MGGIIFHKWTIYSISIDITAVSDVIASSCADAAAAASYWLRRVLYGGGRHRAKGAGVPAIGDRAYNASLPCLLLND